MRSLPCERQDRRSSEARTNVSCRSFEIRSTMHDTRHVQRVYLVLLLFHTLAASFIWGINTLFLLDGRRLKLGIAR